MAKARQVLFRIFYSTTFTIIFFVLIAFACLSPADTLYQSYHRSRIIDIFLISGVYIVTGLIAALIYASRLFTNRSVLKEIPKTYMPIDRDDLPSTRTWRFIADGLARSAVIAYQAKPRRRWMEDDPDRTHARIAQVLSPESGKDKQAVKINTDWSMIQHPGWSSPAATELPELHYETVVAELIDLIEAKAVSLAPADASEAPPTENELAIPDSRVIEALTRSPDAGMRSYIAQLASLEVVAHDDLTVAFIQLYERARFASRPLSGVDFQTLMRMFAEVLRSMKPVNLDLVDFGSASDDDDDDDDSDEAGDEAISEDIESVRRPRRSGKQQQSAERYPNASTSSISSAASNNSVVHRTPPNAIVDDSASSHAADEESTLSPRSNPHSRSRHAVMRASKPTPSDRGPAPNSSRTRSLQQRPSTRSGASTNSVRSAARSTHSGRSGKGSVVVQLTDESEGGRQSGSLPYAIEVPSAVVPVVIIDDR